MISPGLSAYLKSATWKGIFVQLFFLVCVSYSDRILIFQSIAGFEFCFMHYKEYSKNAFCGGGSDKCKLDLVKTKKSTDIFNEKIEAQKAQRTLSNPTNDDFVEQRGFNRTYLILFNKFN